MEDPNEIMDVPCIETERLILKSLTREHIDFIFQHFGRDETNEYSGFDNLATVEEAYDLFDKYIAPTPTRFRLGVALKETAELIGTLGYYNWSKKDCRAEIGCDLAKPYWGQGIMTEALRALIRFGFEGMRLNRIEATTNSRNKRAIGLIERIGFQKEGVLRRKHYYKGQFHDDVVYSLLREEWITAQEEQ